MPEEFDQVGVVFWGDFVPDHTILWPDQTKYSLIRRFCHLIRWSLAEILPDQQTWSHACTSARFACTCGLFFTDFGSEEHGSATLIRWSLPEILPDQNMQKHPKKIFWPFLGSIGGCMYLSLSLATETSYRSLDHPERFQPRPPRLVKIFTKNKRRSVTPFDVTIYQKQFSVTLRSLCAYGANISLSSYWSHYL